MKRKIIALLFLLMGCTFLNAAPYSEKIKELAHIRMDFAGIMQTIGIKGRYVGFTYIRPLYGFAPFWRS